MNRPKRKSRAQAAVATCSIHHELVNSLGDLRTSQELTHQTLTSVVVPMLQKHDKWLLGDGDPKQGFLWKASKMKTQLTIGIFVLSSLIGYFAGNTWFANIIHFVLKILNLT